MGRGLHPVHAFSFCIIYFLILLFCSLCSIYADTNLPIFFKRQHVMQTNRHLGFSTAYTGGKQHTGIAFRIFPMDNWSLFPPHHRLRSAFPHSPGRQIYKKKKKEKKVIIRPWQLFPVLRASIHPNEDTWFSL